MDDLKLKEIYFWVSVEQYLCCAIIASRYQSSLMVGTPRQTCDFSCVPSQSSKRLCYCQRIFWRALWKKNKRLKYGQQTKTRCQDLEYNLQTVTYDALQVMHINSGIDWAWSYQVTQLWLAPMLMMPTNSINQFMMLLDSAEQLQVWCLKYFNWSEM